MKIQTKITLLFFSIGTLGLLVFHFAVFYFVSEFNFDDFYKRLEARSKIAAQMSIYADEKRSDYQEMQTRYLERMEDERKYVLSVDSLKDVTSKKPADLPGEFYNNILYKGFARFNKENTFYYGRLFKSEKGNYIVIVSASDPSGFREVETLRRALIIIFAISVLLTYVAGKIFSHYTIRPLTAVIRNVKNISANNLHLRLNEINGKDEMSELVLTFNNMLNRLETAFETQNNFVSNASHELKTPIAIITAEVELMLRQKDISAANRESAQRVLNHAEKLGHIITSLLGLAQTGFDGKKQNWQKIRIDELIFTVVDSIKKIVPESVIHIDFSSLPGDEDKLCSEGNVNLLQLAVSNIVLNACKYSNNQPVEIKVEVNNSTIALIVTDKGIGIPEKEQQHIFEPFFRASNTNEFQGHGIGLPLTLNIIRLHKGSIGIRSQEQIGTEMQVILPLYKKN